MSLNLNLNLPDAKRNGASLLKCKGGDFAMEDCGIAI